jgi:hypothetical protein
MFMEFDRGRSDTKLKKPLHIEIAMIVNRLLSKSFSIVVATIFSRPTKISD